MPFIKKYDIPPAQAYELDTGLDLPAKIDLVLPSGKVSPVPTGIYLDIPQIPFAFELGRIFGVCPVFDVSIRSRSGLAKRGIFVANSPATIDTNYKGELIVLLFNSTDTSYRISRGDYIAQMVISFALAPYMSQGYRGYNGFGSSY